MNIFEVTPGLLISMAIRYDHSFGMEDWFAISAKNKRPLYEKQIDILDKVAEIYRADGNGDVQLIEEMTGEGFYRPDLESSYVNMATPEGRGRASWLAEIIAQEKAG